MTEMSEQEGDENLNDYCNVEIDDEIFVAIKSYAEKFGIQVLAEKISVCPASVKGWVAKKTTRLTPRNWLNLSPIIGINRTLVSTAKPSLEPALTVSINSSGEIVFNDHRPKTENQPPSAEFKYYSCEDIASMINDGSLFDSISSLKSLDLFFVITGEFKNGWDRNDIAQKITEKGGIFKNRISSYIDILVVGESGSELWFSQQFGTKIFDAVNLRENYGKPLIIKESDFIKLLNI